MYINIKCNAHKSKYSKLFRKQSSRIQVFSHMHLFSISARLLTEIYKNVNDPKMWLECQEPRRVTELLNNEEQTCKCHVT